MYIERDMFLFTKFSMAQGKNVRNKIVLCLPRKSALKILNFYLGLNIGFYYQWKKCFY